MAGHDTFRSDAFPKNLPNLLRVSRSVRSKTTDLGTVLLDVKEGKIFQINPLGSRVWAGLESGASLQQMVEQFSSEFSIPAATVAADIAEFVVFLKNNSLIQE